MKKFVAFSIVLLLLTDNMKSQNGPGGVGDRSGGSFLDLWFDASDLDGDGRVEAGAESGLSGTLVDSWYDKSGNGVIATSLTTPTDRRLTYQVGGNNGYPQLTNTGLDKRLLTDSIDRANNETIFCVSTTLDTANRTIYDGGSIGNTHRLYSHATAAPQMTISGPVSNTSVAFTNQTLITKAFFSDAEAEELQVNQNGNLTTAGTGVNVSANGPLNLGCGTLGSVPSYMNGNVSEFIAFNGRVNAAQSIIIFNYLSAKYAIDLLDLDLYTQDQPINGDYDHEMAGIGRVDASNIHSDAQGTSIVRIDNPIDLSDGEFLLWGHDAGVQEATNTVDVPIGVAARLDRIWRVSEVNMVNADIDVGAIDISFDLTGMGPVIASDLVLLVDADNDGVFSDETPISGATTAGVDVYQFSGVTAIANTLRFTLGTINSTTTSLPIGLAYFDATPIDDYVRLDWRTLYEVSNAYFTVERSLDGLSWEVVERIPGAVYSSIPVNYSTVDEDPYDGFSHYRLKQTDDAGLSVYAAVERVFVGRMNPAVILYPNPVVDYVIVVAEPLETEGIKVYNLSGQVMGPLDITFQTNPAQARINLSQLPSGIYTLKTRTSAMKVLKF